MFENQSGKGEKSSMADYRLNITFKESDLDLIYETNEKVVLVKHTEGNADSQVAWVTFDPLMYNTVDWTNDFAVYASTSDIQNGARINMMSDKMASPKVLYNFYNGYFQNPAIADTMKSNTYAISNNYSKKSALTFGLAQQVVVNNEAFPNKPINAILVPFGQSAQMTPIEKIDVYLMCDIETSTVVSKIMSPVLTVIYGEEDYSNSIEYNSSTGKFFLK